ncbi:hypothetical protein ACWEKR_24530 [Nocardia sp. NPDC004573]
MDGSAEHAPLENDLRGGKRMPGQDRGRKADHATAEPGWTVPG